MADEPKDQSVGLWELSSLLRPLYKHGLSKASHERPCMSGPVRERILEFVVDLDSCSELVETSVYKQLTSHPQVEAVRYSEAGPPADAVETVVCGAARDEVAPGWLLVTETAPPPHMRGEPHWNVVRPSGDGWKQGWFDLGLVTVEWPRSRGPADIRRALPILASDRGGIRLLITTDRTADSERLAHRSRVALLTGREFELLARLFLRRLGLFADRPGDPVESEAGYFVSAAEAAMTATGERWQLQSAFGGRREVFDLGAEKLLTTIIRRCSWTLHERDLLFAELLSEHEPTADHQELRRFEALMIQLHALLECSARLAHSRYLPADRAFTASWGNKSWRQTLLAAAPELTPLVDAPSALLPVLDLVRALRNPLHGEGLTRFHANRLDRPHDVPERLVHTPADDKVSDEIRNAIEALGGGNPADLDQVREGWVARMGPLAEWVTPIVFAAVDALVEHLVQIPDPLPGGMTVLDPTDPHRVRFEHGQRLRLQALGITAAAS